MKKITTIVLTVLIVFCFSINVFATSGPITKVIDVYNDNYRLLVTLYDSDTYISMTSLLLSKHHIYSNIRVDVQCVIYYTDNSFDSGYGNGSFQYYTQNDYYTVVYYNTSKTISHIDTDTHVYINGTYYDTIPCSFSYPL